MPCLRSDSCRQQSLLRPCKSRPSSPRGPSEVEIAFSLRLVMDGGDTKAAGLAARHGPFDRIADRQSQ